MGVERAAVQRGVGQHCWLSFVEDTDKRVVTRPKKCRKSLDVIGGAIDFGGNGYLAALKVGTADEGAGVAHAHNLVEQDREDFFRSLGQEESQGRLARKARPALQLLDARHLRTPRHRGHTLL